MQSNMCVNVGQGIAMIIDNNLTEKVKLNNFN
ncbi:MAG: hypothetical protein ACI9HU_001507 [Colwellia sp.]|jgi:hypothetical protein